MYRIVPLSVLVFPILLHADEYVRQPAIDVIHYEIALELTDTSEALTGTTRVHVMMRQDGVDRMWLDFAGMSVGKLLVGGVERPFTHGNGRLSFQLDRPYQRGELATVEVRYHGQCADAGLRVRKNHYGRRVYFAENWPDKAHQWFPSVDHPSDKATVDFAITAPANYDVVCNGRLVETRSLLDGRKLTRWGESEPVPTYCMVVGAAEFSIVHAGSGAGVPLEFYVFPQDAAAAARKFARSNLMLLYFSGLVGPYPFEKLAQVESTTTIGGMENSSAIFYTESIFQQDQPGEAPVPHEVAHQWFGDSVTPGDWDHLWLSEGIATYFNALFYEHLEGAEAMKQWMTHSAEAVKKYHREHPGPVVDPSVKDISRKLNALTYDKGAWILHMLRAVLGDEVFFRGIRHYYGLHAEGTVLTSDFQRVMESESGKSLHDFFSQWLYQPGWPDYQITWHWNDRTSETELTVRQIQETGLFDMPVDLMFRCTGRTERRTLQISSESKTFALPLPCKPHAMEVDPDGKLLKNVTVSYR